MLPEPVIIMACFRSSRSKLNARPGPAGLGGFHSEVRRRASALAFSVVGETGAARREARSASGPPKEAVLVLLFVVDMFVLV